jgi:hypothetical protein
MKYVGKLFGQIGRTRGYFDTGKTSGDWDALEARSERAEAEVGRLIDIINRSSVQFFHDGTDGETAAKMLTVLNEAKP